LPKQLRHRNLPSFSKHLLQEGSLEAAVDPNIHRYTSLSEGSTQREVCSGTIYVTLSIKPLRMCVFHTFPLLSLLGARRSGIGIGGSEVASLIASADLGVWS
jgi:hypothetical protein